MSRAWLHLAGGLFLLGSALGGFLWFALGPEETVKRTLEGAHLLFQALVLGTPLGVLLLLFALLGGGAIPAPSKDTETTTVLVLTSSLLLGSKRDLLDP